MTMKRHIKASEVKPGMEIEWRKDGWTHSGTIAVAREAGFSQPLMHLQNTEHLWEYVGLDQEVTVLREAQPEEPTAFGACVEVAGAKYVMASHFSQARWIDEYDQWNRWGTLCERGPVEVKPNPFGTPAQDATEPRMWDRWEDVPDMVAVRTENGVVVARRYGDCVYRLFSDGDWGRSMLTAHDLNVLAPLTEVPDA